MTNVVSFWKIQGWLARCYSQLEAVREADFTNVQNNFQTTSVHQRVTLSVYPSITLHFVLVSLKTILHVLDILYCV